MPSEPEIAISIKVVLILASKLIVELPKGMEKIIIVVYIMFTCNCFTGINISINLCKLLFFLIIFFLPPVFIEAATCVRLLTTVIICSFHVLPNMK